MEHLLEYATSPAGQELTHGIVLLTVAIASWITYQTREQAKRNERKLDGHLEQHLMGTAHTTSSVIEQPSEDI